MESTSIQIPESNQVQSLRKGCDAWCLFGRPAHHTPCRTISRVKRLLCFFVGVTISHSLSRHNRFREHVRRKLKTMKLPCWRPSVCHLFTVCLMFFPQTACPHWGVLRVRIKIGFVQGWHLGPPFLLHTSSFLRCPCGFRLRGLARNVCRIWLLSEGLVLPAMCMFPGRRSIWWVWAMFWKSRKLVLWNHRCCCFGAWAHFFVPGAVLQKPWQKRGWSLDKLFFGFTKFMLRAWRNSNMLVQPSRHPVRSDNSRRGAMQILMSLAQPSRRFVQVRSLSWWRGAYLSWFRDPGKKSRWVLWKVLLWWPCESFIVHDSAIL